MINCHRDCANRSPSVCGDCESHSNFREPVIIPEVESRRRILHELRIKACSAWSDVMTGGELNLDKADKARKLEGRLQLRVEEAMNSLRELHIKNQEVALLILKNDKERAVKWAAGLLLSSQAHHLAPLTVSTLKDSVDEEHRVA